MAVATNRCEKSVEAGLSVAICRRWTFWKRHSGARRKQENNSSPIHRETRLAIFFGLLLQSSTRYRELRHGYSIHR